MKRFKYKRPVPKPYCEPDYDKPEHKHQSPSENPRYPDKRIYGTYASKKPPKYIPHPYEHSSFCPREEDYKPPITCDDDKPGLCVRRDNRALTGDQQTRLCHQGHGNGHTLTHATGKVVRITIKLFG